MIGKRVRVKRADSSFYPGWIGSVGLVIAPYEALREAWIVDLNVDEAGNGGKVYFFTDELTVLGGKHAGNPHPENFTGPLPENRLFSVHDSVFEAEDHGKHAGLADLNAEVDAWEAERAYL